MIAWSQTLRSSLVSVSYASLASTVALALAAWSEGKGALQPINATSHWRYGNAAASRRGLDAAHTGTGYATNHAASVF